MRHHSEFSGNHIPFGAKAYYKPSPTKKLDNVTKFGPTLRVGVFAGYKVLSGYTWKHEYMVWDLDDFLETDLFEGKAGLSRKHRNPHVTNHCCLPQGNIEYPLKSTFDIVNGTLEGKKRARGIPEAVNARDPGGDGDGDVSSDPALVEPLLPPANPDVSSGGGASSSSGTANNPACEAGGESATLDRQNIPSVGDNPGVHDPGGPEVPDPLLSEEPHEHFKAWENNKIYAALPHSMKIISDFYDSSGERIQRRITTGKCFVTLTRDLQHVWHKVRCMIVRDEDGNKMRYASIEHGKMLSTPSPVLVVRGMTRFIANGVVNS